MIQDEAAARAKAKAAGLRYRFDDTPGIRRAGSGATTTYLDPEGREIRDPAVLERIRMLVIPPAWTEVWISPDARGHIQATGRDARGRKQYRYHSKWRELRDSDKFSRMIAFGRALPAIRARVDEDLARRGLPREKVLATIVKLLELSMIRIGNQEYARSNQSFGLTTLRDRHVELDGSTVTFDFKGKAGKRHRIKVADRRIARIVRNCRDLPGYELFQYLDQDGQRHTVDSGDVNDYLRDIVGEAFSAKDFRTWAGTVLAAMALQELQDFTSQTDAKRRLKAAIEHVAARLGNTPTICRRCYVHPAVVEAYLGRDLIRGLERRADAMLTDSEEMSRLDPEEAAVLGLLRARLAREERERRAA